MKSNKLILGLLATSITINVVLVLGGFGDQRSASSAASLSNLTNLSGTPDTSSLFEHDLDLGETLIEDQTDDQLQALRKKMAILTTQNKALQTQLEDSDLQQSAIIKALTVITDKIDSEYLTPIATSSDFQPSNYNLNFSSIPREVVKRCMKLTASATSNIRQQQQQSREQLLLNEEIDVAWSSEIESNVQSILSDRVLQDSELVSLNCRTTICQITVQHSSDVAKKLFEEPFFSQFQNSVSQYEEKFDDATNLSTGIFYLTRNKE